MSRAPARWTSRPACHPCPGTAGCGWWPAGSRHAPAVPGPLLDRVPEPVLGPGARRMGQPAVEVEGVGFLGRSRSARLAASRLTFGMPVDDGGSKDGSLVTVRQDARAVAKGGRAGRDDVEKRWGQPVGSGEPAAAWERPRGGLERDGPDRPGEAGLGSRPAPSRGSATRVRPSRARTGRARSPWMGPGRRTSAGAAGGSPWTTRWRRPGWGQFVDARRRPARTDQ